ncbi:MAG: ribulose-phosphate 3-epimerase [Parcubacteria group bacterium]|nr:ribulose-phosphate 3-epimerase [Parcubacteria group bacterium]
MIQIIPTIIAKDFEELQEKIRKVEPYVDWIQLDVMDNKFVDNITWNQPSDLKDLKTDSNLEVHLMIQNPEDYINNWIESGVKRIIFHYESTDKHKEIIEKIKQADLGVGIAINPETSIEVIDNFIEELDLVLIMTVHPGFGNQDFLKQTLGKIKELRGKDENVNIEVDGGIDLEIAPKVIQAGANLLAIGSAIFKSENIKKTIEDLKNGH